MSVKSAIGRKPENLGVRGGVLVLLETTFWGLRTPVQSQKASTLVGPAMQTSPRPRPGCPRPGSLNIPTPSGDDTPAGAQMGFHSNKA